jgi:hypothetical protein
MELYRGNRVGPINIVKDTTLVLSPSEFNLILAGVDELPHKFAKPLLNSIHSQAYAQHAGEPPPGMKNNAGQPMTKEDLRSAGMLPPDPSVPVPETPPAETSPQS